MKRMRFFMGVAMGGIAAMIGASGVVAQEQAATPPADPIAYPGWVTPKKHEKLAPHPRLVVSQEQIDRMVKGRGEAYASDYEAVTAAANAALLDTDDPFKGESPLGRSFGMVGRTLALSVEWHRTRDRKYLDAAVRNIEAMKPWMPPDGQIILWEGQQIAAVAMTYDLLHNDLTPEQRAALVAFARTHCIEPFLRVTGSRANPMVEGERGSWWQRIISNWNPVCVAGPGMLALAMYEDFPEAQTVLDRVDESLAPILAELEKTKGGWVEGLGYWNWTIHYMSLYMISHERATGQAYPGFRSDGFRETLRFVVDFVPYDQACGFGDNQHGQISPSLLAAAEHLGHREVVRELQDYEVRRDRYAALKKQKLADAAKQPATDAPAKKGHLGYDTPLSLLIGPDASDVPPVPVRQNVSHTHPEQGWGMVADRWPEPNVYAAFRGGVMSGAHTHADLLSWHGIVGMERMILDYNKSGYYSPSFGARAKEIYERNPAAKNTIFIAGLSAYINSSRARPDPARAESTQFQLPAGAAVRLEATRAFWLASANPKLVARLFVNLGDKGILVLDRIEQPGQNPVEIRTHTDREAEFGETDVLLAGDFETARMTFASDQPTVLRRAEALLTDARATPPTMMRFQTLGSVRNVTMASLLSKGSDPVALSVQSDESSVTVTAEGKGWREEVRVTNRLEAPESDAPGTRE